MDFIRQGTKTTLNPSVHHGVLEKLLEYSSDILYEDKEVNGNGKWKHQKFVYILDVNEIQTKITLNS